MSDILLVTGGAGFIGARVVATARAAGRRVRVLDSLRADVHPAPAGPGHEWRRSPHGRAGCEGSRHAPLPEDVEFVRGDVGDPEVCAAALRGVTAVCHLAAKVGLGVDLSDAPDYVRSNVLGTAVLLAAMADAGVDRMVLASSMVVYGEGRYRDGQGPVAAAPRRIADLQQGMFEPRSPRTGEPLVPEQIDETAPTDPRNVYATTKLAQEHLVASWARETGGRAALLRFHNVYGPGMPQGTPYAGVAALFRTEAEAGRPPLVFEDGGQRRDFVHVDDVAAANLAALDWTAGQDAGVTRAFNVATGQPRTVGELAAALAAARRAPAPIVTGRFRPGDVRHITASGERIRAELSWRPQVAFADGVRDFATAPMRPPAAAGPERAR